MKRTKIKDRVLPTYTKGEEIFNMTSHIVGAVLGIVTTVLCIVMAALHRSTYGIVSSSIYGTTMIILYTMSSVYHGLSPRKSTGKKVLQVLDHCTIFLLIAGSYTPIALCAFREYNPVLGWTMFGVVWVAAILGIVLNAIDLEKYKSKMIIKMGLDDKFKEKFSMICYLAMGWVVIFRADLLPVVLGKNGLILLVAGGIAYTIGAVLYGLGRKHKYMHSIFHLFIVLGSLLHFFCILFYVV